MTQLNFSYAFMCNFCNVNVETMIYLSNNVSSDIQWTQNTKTFINLEHDYCTLGIKNNDLSHDDNCYERRGKKVIITVLLNPKMIPLSKSSRPTK